MPPDSAATAMTRSNRRSNMLPATQNPAESTQPTLQPKLQFSVQYAVPAEPNTLSVDQRLTRARLRRWVLSALRAVQCPEASMTLRLVDTPEGRELNAGFRGKDYATNILTFAYDTNPVQADLVLCVPVLDREAAEQGKPWLHHAAHLIVHGTLHACGYDHETDAEAEAMEALETRILARMGIADPYESDFFLGD